MRWRRGWPSKPPRPTVRRLAANEQEELLATMTRAVSRSPVLAAFQVEVRCLRGRFYLERPTSTGIQQWAPITPLPETLLLEVERRTGSWFTVAEGSGPTLIKKIANDREGTFHGLGALEKSLVQAGQGLARLAVKVAGQSRFTYADTGKPCTTQEALFHFFGLPVEVIAEPAHWYRYHRQPHIVEFSADRTKVLVRFSAVSLSGEGFGGTCLYLLRDGNWSAFTIKPSESRNIAVAESWLIKRKWKEWS